ARHGHGQERWMGRDGVCDSAYFLGVRGSGGESVCVFVPSQPPTPSPNPFLFLPPRGPTAGNRLVGTATAGRPCEAAPGSSFLAPRGLEDWRARARLGLDAQRPLLQRVQTVAQRCRLLEL